MNRFLQLSQYVESCVSASLCILSPVDKGQRVCFDIIACHGHKVLGSSPVDDVFSHSLCLMHVESFTTLGHIFP